MVFCPKCGEAIPDESVTCPKCGAELKNQEEQAVVYASQTVNGSEATTEVKAKSKVPNGIKIAIAAVVVLAIAFFVVNEMGKASVLYQ